MHTWKPDTYGESPALVAGLMAGGLTTCAFLGIARATEVTTAAGLASFARPPLVAFGLLSLAVAAAFVIGQSDIRRLLAYSSVEHVGLLVLGLGLWFGIDPIALAGAALVAHTGADRLLGFGLKYPTGFADTHLGRIGRRP